MAMPKYKKYQKKKSYPEFVAILCLAALGLSIAGYFIIYRPYAIYRERKQFKQAEAYVSQLADQIQAKVGKADQVKKENYCQRAHLKNDQGPLSCVTAAYLLYDNRDLTAANTLMSDIATLNNVPLKYSLGNITVTRFSNDLGSGPQAFYQNITSTTGLDCSDGFTYRYLDGPDSSLHPKTNTSLFIEISCSDWPISELYPVRP